MREKAYHQVRLVLSRLLRRVRFIIESPEIPVFPHARAFMGLGWGLGGTVIRSAQ